MASFLCPFCNVNVSQTLATKKNHRTCFNYQGSKAETEYIDIGFYRCPNCENIHVKAVSESEYFGEFNMPIFPKSLAKKFPEYVPQCVREDYEEAYSIITLSPKASATLSRRCLQAMIHDFWGIHEKNLNAEITALKSKIQPDLWKAIDGVRSIGNIGAHMEKDINMIIDISPGEAEKLLKLIEYLIENWYIERHKQQELFTDITKINDAMQEKRNADVK